MNTVKSALLGKGGVPTPEQLAKINLQSKAELQAEQVYCFSVRLCDDQPDRDHERFDTAALPVLAELFIGKTGICDHEWSAQGQIARIFDAWTESAGEATILRAWAYMLRGEDTDPIIAKIEAGIHREVSVGCAMEKTLCSICGAQYGTCEHRKGEVYGGEVCYGILCGAKDAYEFSFVAVPAQSEAGVLKGFEENDPRLLELKRKAELGERYLSAQRKEAVRLALSLGLQVENALLETMAKALNEEELSRLNGALKALQDRKFACKTQLPTAKSKPFGIGTEFLI